MAGSMYVIRALADGTHRIVKTERGVNGLQPMYDAIGCQYVEMVGRGNLGGVPVALLVDEEGLLVQNPRINLTACDVFAVATKSAPMYLRGGIQAKQSPTGSPSRKFARGLMTQKRAAEPQRARKR